MAVVLDPRKKLRFLKFCFFEIYGNEVADEMVELVRGSLVKLYDYYSYVDSPNVQVPSGSERTHIEGKSISCRNPYAMVNSRFEHFLEAKQSIGYSNEIDKYLAENCESRKGDVKFEILGGGRTTQIGIKCYPNWLGMCWLYLFLLLLLSQRLDRKSVV